METDREHGRRSRRRDARQWAKLVRAWKRSGLTAREFSSSHQLNASSLIWWRWRLGRGAVGDTAAQPLRLARVDVTPDGRELKDADNRSVRWELTTTRGTLRVHDPLSAQTLDGLLPVLLACRARRAKR